MTIEEFLILWLSGKLTVPVSGDVPTPMPASFVTLERVGAETVEHIRHASIAIRTWAQTRAAAGRLCELVEQTMEELTAETEISSCKLENSYNDTDLDTKTPRYQAIFEIVYNI